jgi:hypothetical protein
MTRACEDSSHIARACGPMHLQFSDHCSHIQFYLAALHNQLALLRCVGRQSWRLTRLGLTRGATSITGRDVKARCRCCCCCC